MMIFEPDGSNNPADILTKYLGSELMASHLLRMGCVMLEGKADLAPNVQKGSEYQPAGRCRVQGECEEIDG